MATTLSLLRFAPLPSRITRSSLTVNLTPSPNRSVRIRPRVPPSSASYTVPVIDRLVSMLSYTIPFLDILPCSCFLRWRYPLFASLISSFLHMMMAYNNTARLDFLVFLTLYVYLAQNPNMSRYVRFNAMQVVMLDVILTLPGFVKSIVGAPSSRIGLRVLEFGYGAIFVLGFVTFVYSVLCCLVGRTPYLPFISSAADKQL